jgi:hypothetical protein
LLSEADISNALSAGERNFRYLLNPQGGNVAGSKLLLSANSSAGNGNIYKWVFADGEKVYAPTAVRNIRSAGTESFMLIVSKSGFPDDTLQNQISFSTASEACLASFSTVRLSSTLFRLIAPQGFDTYQWDIEGNSLNGRIQDIDLSAYSIARVQLNASKSGCTASFKRKIAVNNTFNGCIADMEAKTEVVDFTVDTEHIPFNEAEITFTDSLGNIYSSLSSYPRTIAGRINILNSASFSKNEKAQKTMRVELQFEGYLFKKDQPSDSIWIKTQRWISAISYPAL